MCADGSLGTPTPHRHGHEVSNLGMVVLDSISGDQSSAGLEIHDVLEMNSELTIK